MSGRKISIEGEDLCVDAGTLAEAFEITPEVVMAGLRDGAITTLTERGTGEDARALAAQFLPPGIAVCGWSSMIPRDPATFAYRFRRCAASPGHAPPRHLNARPRHSAAEHAIGARSDLTESGRALQVIFSTHHFSVSPYPT